MARFDVYANPDKDERKLVPFYLDVQSDFIRGMKTRIVVPLWKAGLFPIRAENLNPEFGIEGQRVVMDIPALGAVPTAEFRPAIGILASQQSTIQDALDALFGSY